MHTVRKYSPIELRSRRHGIGEERFFSLRTNVFGARKSEILAWTYWGKACTWVVSYTHSSLSVQLRSVRNEKYIVHVRVFNLQL